MGIYIIKQSNLVEVEENKMPDDLILVNIKHARIARFCGRGIMKFGRLYKIDMHAFCKEGVPIEVFERIPDHYMQKIAEIARKEHADGRRR
jgi:hypothetical protein